MPCNGGRILTSARRSLHRPVIASAWRDGRFMPLDVDVRRQLRDLLGDGRLADDARRLWRRTSTLAGKLQDVPGVLRVLQAAPGPDARVESTP